MKINIYTIPNCPYCNQLKDLLAKDIIEYNEIDVSLDENEEQFNQLSELCGSQSVPMVTVGKHLLAPDVNFSSIEQAHRLVQHILETEKE